MAAEKKGQIIVIKKVYVNGAGHHGGSWKVALADFMTALMAFFLVMWLLSQSAETKKAVSDYFSTPSIIEYNFQNYGVEITLEKLFLDFVNEPMKAFQSFLEPIDKTPNLLDMGSAKVVQAYLQNELKEIAQNMTVEEDGMKIVFEDSKFFIPGTAEPSKDFFENIAKLKGITTGLADATIDIKSFLYEQSVEESSPELARKIASQRAAILNLKIKSSLEHDSISLNAYSIVESHKTYIEGQGKRPLGKIEIQVKMKDKKVDGTKQRKLETVFGTGDDSKDVYSSFAVQASKKRSTRDDSSNRKFEGNQKSLQMPESGHVTDKNLNDKEKSQSEE